MDWEVLEETGKRGIYAGGDPTPVEDAELIAWLMEASLHARSNGTAALKELLDSPSLFPFQLRPIPSNELAAASSRLSLVRHGLDGELIVLRERISM